jgi:hypothetical protein
MIFELTKIYYDNHVIYDFVKGEDIEKTKKRINIMIERATKTLFTDYFGVKSFTLVACSRA